MTVDTGVQDVTNWRDHLRRKTRNIDQGTDNIDIELKVDQRVGRRDQRHILKITEEQGNYI